MYVSIVSRRTLLLICFFVPCTHCTSRRGFPENEAWNDLAFSHLDEEKSTEGKTGAPESHAILVKFDSVMKAWRIASCNQVSVILPGYAPFHSVSWHLYRP
jgi:hypothetical protein